MIDLVARGVVAIVAASAPEDLRDEIAGDLLEAWRVEERSGRGMFSSWCWWVAQAAGSLPALLARRWERFELQPAFAGFVTAAFVTISAVAAGMACWGWLLAQVPLRAGHSAPLAWRICGMALALVIAWVAGRFAARRFRGSRRESS